MPKLMDHLSIDSFKNNPAVNGIDLIEVKVLSTEAQGFVRLGSTKTNSELTPDMIKRIDKWIDENLKGSDFKFRN